MSNYLRLTTSTQRYPHDDLLQAVVDSTSVTETLILRVSSASIPGAAVAGAQFTEGDQLQVKFILQLSGLLSQICNEHTHTRWHNILIKTAHFSLLPKQRQW